MTEYNQETLSKIVVLVVEKDPELAAKLEKSIHNYDGEAFLAASAQEAFQLLMEHDFDLCIIDLDMSNMDSVAFLQEVLKVWPWLGVVALVSDNSRREQLSEIGTFSFIGKDFDSETLAAEILDEYRSKCSQRLEEDGHQESVHLEKVQYKMRGLRRLMEGALKANTLVEALRFLCMGIGQILPFAVVGVMGRDEEYLVIFNIQRNVSEKFIGRLTKIIHNRYEALTGREVPSDRIKIEKAGKPTREDGESRIGSTFSVPVITSGELRGIITIATLSDKYYTTADTTFMYYAANQLSTVFAAMTHIRNLAIHDPMTGLYNRLQLDREMDNQWRQFVEAGEPIAVAIMDLDHFKIVNDTYGHLVGDDVLREFAKLLQKNTCEASYVIGRYGGEEFVIIMSGVTQERAVECAITFLEQVRAHVFCKNETPLRITISIGLSSYAPSDSRKLEKNPEQLLTEADQAMYRAKRAGRDCLRVWSDRRAHEEGEETEIEKADDAALKSMYRMKHRNPGIIIIQDDYALRRLLEDIIIKEGYRVECWDNATEAMAQLKKNPAEYDLLLTDLSMRGMKSVEAIREILAIDETLMVIVVASYSSFDKAVECLRVGAYDIIQKEFQSKQVTATLRRALDYRRTLLENRQYEQYLMEMVRQNSARINETMDEIKTSYNFTLEALVGLLDARERDSGNHSKRVRDLTLLLARRMEIVGDELEDIARGALLHDIGKIGVPDSILLKEDSLTEEEWSIIKRHPEVGFRVLQYSSYLKGAAEIVYSHQEKWDGGGYPRGLTGSEICQGARIFAVVDSYDAMRTDRHYRKAMPVKEAVAEIKSQSGRQFDPQVVKAFLKYQGEIENLLQLMLRQSVDEKTDFFPYLT